MPHRIAVIGAGVSGLSATWALNEHPPQAGAEVHLFEPGEYIGGHTHTVRFVPPKNANGQLEETDVDTGFIVFNEVTYPNFLRFLQHTKVPILSSDMSFAVTRSAPNSSPRAQAPFAHPPPNLNAKPDVSASAAAYAGLTDNVVRGAFEWAGTTPAALFCQPTNLFDPAHWRMVWDILRFNVQGLEALRAAEKGGPEARMSIGQWLNRHRYGEGFRRNYLIPMTASIWSTPPATALSSFPASTLLRFMHNHHLMQIFDRPQWLTISGGSKTYVERILSRLPTSQLHQGPEAGNVVSVRRATPAERTAGKGRWVVKTKNGKEQEFEEVVMACHADTALRLLELDGGRDPAGDEAVKKALGKFEFSKNVAVLHNDEELMPVRRGAWAAWNFLAEESDLHPGSRRRDVDRVSLTYWMNLLQTLPTSSHGSVLVTLNPRPGRPDPASIVGKYEYDHPVYTSSSVASQRALAQFQGRDGLHFAGAWLAYGFHEDGFSSGLRAAVALGAQPPFEPRPAERVLPPRSSLLLLFLDLLELTRRASRPFTNLALLIAIWYSVILETVTNLLVTILGGPHAPCGIAADIRTVRASWERARGNESGNYWTKLERNSPPRGTVRSAAQMANEHSKAE